MIEMHKKQLEWFKSKLGISDYTVAWIAFLKGLILGILIYHFFYKRLDFDLKIVLKSI